MQCIGFITVALRCKEHIRLFSVFLHLFPLKVKNVEHSKRSTFFSNAVESLPVSQLLIRWNRIESVNTLTHLSMQSISAFRIRCNYNMINNYVDVLCTSSTEFEIHLNCIRNAFKMHWIFVCMQKFIFICKSSQVNCLNAQPHKYFDKHLIRATSSTGELQLFPVKCERLAKHCFCIFDVFIKCKFSLIKRRTFCIYSFAWLNRKPCLMIFVLLLDKYDTFKTRVRSILLCIMHFGTRNTIIERPTNVPTIAFVWKSFSSEKLYLDNDDFETQYNTIQNPTWRYSWLHDFIFLLFFFFFSNFRCWRRVHIDTVLMLITKSPFILLPRNTIELDAENRLNFNGLGNVRILILTHTKRSHEIKIKSDLLSMMRALIVYVMAFLSPRKCKLLKMFKLKTHVQHMIDANYKQWAGLFFLSNASLT